jgi:hypothetical protein
MKQLWDNCLEYFQTNEAKRNFNKCILTPLGENLYQEFYLYVWIICFYHIFLILMVFGIFVLLVRLDHGFFPLVVV